MSPGSSIHASCVMIGQIGVLIRGPAGAGKSTLAWTLIETETNAGRPAVLVADDRVLLAVEEGGLVARAPERLAGMIELRGLGLLSVAFVPQARLGLVVDLVEDLPHRLPLPQEQVIDIEGVSLPHLAVQRALAAILIRARLNPTVTIVASDKPA